ncbi:MAG: DUF512 domain-containing protein [Clostridia bacterium]|nr:DUF512 domain-containing protein [Clostridia bacterium]
MEHLITCVDPGSEADRHGVCAGDVLLSLNGEKIIDQIDYQALSARRHILMHIRKNDGKEWHLELIKPAGKPLGLHFGKSMELAPRVCKNKCIFCFIDQMPPACRQSLYVKDDDWRMSLLMGNFITMTNMDDAEFDRIVRRKVSPLFISVHAAEPDLRVKMMANPEAAKLMDRLNILKNNGIRFHCQIVLCPGINDGEHLEHTLYSLHSLYPAARSAALVPVGLTRYREGLYPLRPFTRSEAIQVMEICKKWQSVFLSESDTRFVFPSDELICLSGYDLPDADYYENFPQIENGVGLMRQFLDDLAAASAKGGDAYPRRVLIPCGTSIAPYMQEWINRYGPKGAEAHVLPVKNRFFGETVTVTGLLTGKDILDQIDPSQTDEVILCNVTLRESGDLFLDDMPLEVFKRSLPVPVTVIPNNGRSLYQALLHRPQKEKA